MQTFTKRKLAIIAFVLAIQASQFSVHGIDFGFSSIVGNITKGAANAATASVGAVASVPGYIAKPLSGSIKAPDVEESSTKAPLQSDTSDSVETTLPSQIAETTISSMSPATSNKTENSTTSSSWIPSPIKKPVDVIVGLPNTVVTGAGDAWRTVSETVVNTDPAESVKFYFYDDPKNLESFKLIVPSEVDSLKSVHIPEGQGLNIVIHGFMQDINSSFLQETKDTILLHNGGPVICVDWGHMADGKIGPEVARALLYPFVVDNVPVVGEYVGDFIVLLRNNSVFSNFDKIHVLGFSLGAHVSGLAGWTVQNRTGEKIARITGLDPAGPKFFLKTKERRLNGDDAKFVDVIHTSHLGYFLQMGHIDFFPNGGKIQPGCVETEGGVTDTVTSLGSLLTGSCSHSRAWQYYVRSIKDNELYGCECNNIFKYEFTGCEANCEDKIPFGDLTPKSARGNYYLSL